MIIESGVNIGAGIGIFSTVIAATANPSPQYAEETLTISGFTPLTVINDTGTPPYTYVVVGGVLPTGLSLNPTTGVVTGTVGNAAAGSYTVTFGVRDLNGFIASTTSTVVITVYSKVSATSTPTPQFLEVGTLLVNFQPLIATGGNLSYTYYVSSGTLPAGLILNSSTGVISGTPTTAASVTSLTISVKDSYNIVSDISSTVDFTVYPRITATATTTAQFLEVGTVMVNFRPLLATNGSGVYTYGLATGSVLPAGLTLDPTTGFVSGTPTSSSFGTANVVFTVKDSLNVIASTTSTVSFTVYPTIVATATPSTQSLETTFVITSFRPLVASGGSGTYTYYVSSGTLPAGLTLTASNGFISGTPTVATTGNVVISVKDSLNVVASTTSTVSFTVYTGLTAVANTTTQLLEVGVAMTNFTPLTASNGLAPYVYSVQSGSLPAGLTYNSSTGVISGTPTTASATGNIVFKVTDALNKVATTTSTVSFTVYSAITATANSIVLQELEVGLATSSYQPLTASGGSGTYTYYIVSGTLPSGLTLNASTGIITGTPTTSYSPANVRFGVKDSLNVVASTTLNVAYTVFSLIAATPDTTARTFNVNVAITPFTPLTATGGTGIYTYSISSGTLPAGLSYNATTGVVSGTPTVAVTRTITFTVKDSFNVPAATTSTVTVATVGIPVTISYLVIGGGGGGGGSQYNPLSVGGGNGGGGGGQFVESSVTIPSTNVITLTIGGGGTAGFGYTTQTGGTGGSSSIAPGNPTIATVPSIGGAGGSGRGGVPGNNMVASPGNAGGLAGAGGGAGGLLYSGQTSYPYTPASGASGTQPSGGSPGYGGGGGGGGAGTSGSTGFVSVPFGGPGYGGAGGTGRPSSVTGVGVYYAGGGGGGSAGVGDTSRYGAGGSGGGGSGTTAGASNTGGGGGGGHASGAGSAGGSGVIILSLPTINYSGIYTGAVVVTTSGSNTILKFNTSGTYTV